MIPLFKVFMNNNVSKDLEKILMSGHITQGNQVDIFESKLQEYIGNKYILTFI